ncbi:hypothetical protein BD626DRAFT_221302 [Schizophyllum amplum]|uniref:Uncharacterized protein n=1 Tax=Schizophyllum amplum TaxID=97359 RepID=A0A550CLC2_9AGAR|nr:hypothetical protein BD626DRAFT_221302 [Auriculariopsis ampla]
MSSVSSTAPPSAPTSPRKSPGKLHLRVPLQKLARRVSHFDFHHHRREESEGMPEHRRAASTSHMEPVRSVSVAVAPSLVVSASKGRESSESESSSSGGEDRTSEHGLLSEEEAPKLEPAWSELDFADSAGTHRVAFRHFDLTLLCSIDPNDTGFCPPRREHGRGGGEGGRADGFRRLSEYGRCVHRPSCFLPSS